MCSKDACPPPPALWHTRDQEEMTAVDQGAGNSAAKRWASLLVPGILSLLTAGLSTAGASSLPVTFNRDVLPILQSNCQSCHRPGEVAPMSFLTYESTRPWAKAIKVAVLTRKMPPWPADPRFGQFLHDRTLNPEDMATLTSWVDSGAPEGDAKDKPPEKRWPTGWNIPPDAVVSLPEPISIPAKGTVELTEIRVPTGFTKDTWINSIEIQPGNRSVVHHVVVCIVPHSDDAENGVARAPKQRRDAEGIAIKKIQRDDRLRSPTGVDAIYVPGAPLVDYRLHHAAKLIPAGSDLLIQLHYTPNGVATTDQTRIGFTFAKDEPARRFITVNPTALRDRAHFRIPAGDPNWETRTELVFNEDAEIVWFMPHMHLRGKDMTYRLVYPNGESRTLLSVKFSFQWQMSYDVAEPIVVPKGTKLEVVAHFDNSANNRFNPDPNADVWWGDQTWEEMMVAWLGVVVDKDKELPKVVSYTPEFSECSPGGGKRETKLCREAGILLR
jgi:hypothetical protein